MAEEFGSLFDAFSDSAPHSVEPEPDDISAADMATELRGLERRLDRSYALAERCVQEHAELLAQVREQDAFLALAPQASQRLEELAAKLFGEILDEIEDNLTHAVREILGQERTVVTRREIKNNRLFIEFEIESPDGVENILFGQGGSVCNILSVGLRLIALSRLDEAEHRPFLVLDEQDCWLKPELVPTFMKLIAKIAASLGLQVLVISHHPIDMFSTYADRIYELRADRAHGVGVGLLKSS